MALKGLVRFFTILLILISLYQLSFTWIVYNFESTQKEKAEKLAKKFYPQASKQTRDSAAKAFYSRALDSLKDKVLLDIPILYSELTYQKATEQELNLGLDLQGGMSVVLEVSLDGLVRSLSNNPKDSSINKALDLAVQRKANSDADFISLFKESFSQVLPGKRLAGYFATMESASKITANSTDQEVLDYIRSKSDEAIEITFKRLETRINRFGVAQPNINLDKGKGIITVELAGVDNPERVRKYLQATANLEFWETYVIDDYFISQYINPIDAKISGYLANNNLKGDSSNASIAAFNQKPLTSLITRSQNQNTLIIKVRDTATFSKYIQLPYVRSGLPSDLRFLFGAKPIQQKNVKGAKKTEKEIEIYAIRTVLGSDKPKVGGDVIENASSDYSNDLSNRGYVIKMEMDNKGANAWRQMTSDNKGKAIAIVLDNVVYSAPVVNDVISTGSSQISGDFTAEEAEDLASILKIGKLPATTRIVQSQEVGPTLGEETVKGGIMSFVISFAVIFLLMLVYYNSSGWVANIALILNLLFTVGVLSAIGATLTAAGIAGLVLTIGMAVDTNVIIFERIKEELSKGKNYQTAVNDGYKRSMAPVLDAHITTLITAIILLNFGLGPILGFATTQILGILLSLFCGILISRLFTDFWTNKKRHFQYFTGVSRRVFKHSAFKFIEYRKYAYGISIIILILGVAAIIHGFDYGVEFKGGRSYTVAFDREMKNEDVRLEILKVTGRNPIIKTVGNSKQLNITTDYLIEKPGATIDSQVQVKLYEGLKKFLPAGTTLQEFEKKYKKSSQTVLPTISQRLINGAKVATIISLIFITLYIFLRFRDWRYSVGTIVALLHDVLVTLAVFSFLREIVPFPLEIDQHFIAAVLTVIGFSMNDTVIVFDRVREYSKTMYGQDKKTIINKAINDTLSRTIMTSLTVFLTILILFIFGGEVTRGFAFAMLIGVFTGTYSSIFVAAPILIDFAKNKPLGDRAKDKTLAKARHTIG